MPPPDEALSEATDTIAAILKEAVELGHAIAAEATGTTTTTATAQRGIVGSVFGDNLVARATQIVSGVIGSLVSTVQSLFAAFRGSNSGTPIDDNAVGEVSDDVTEWAGGYVDTVGITEVTDVIEETVFIDWGNQGIPEIIWVTEPDACPLCQDNADADAIPYGTEFPGGDGYPPAHPRCRCHLSMP